jgi:Ca2+-binding RTX toxin-like protein
MAVIKTNVSFALDTTDMVELGYLGNWGQLTVPNTAVGKASITVHKGPTYLNLLGNHLTILGAEPVSGSLNKIVVQVGGETQYLIQNLNVVFTVVDPTFSGNWEPNVLGNKDNITGGNLGDNLYSFAGNDIVTARGGNDYIDGGTGADTLNGGDDDDTIKGQNGADLISGGNGINTLTGGNGNDKFVFNSTVDGVTNISHITDFTVDRDLMQLSLADFAGIGAKGALSAAKFAVSAVAVAGKYIIFDSADGELYFNPGGGTDTGAMKLFATVDANIGLFAGDFVVTA